MLLQQQAQNELLMNNSTIDLAEFWHPSAAQEPVGTGECIFL